MNLIVTNLLLATVFFIVCYLQFKKWLLPFLKKMVKDWDVEVEAMANASQKKQVLLEKLNNDLIAQNDENLKIQKKIILWQNFLERRNITLQMFVDTIQNNYELILQARKNECIKRDSLILYKRVVTEESLKKVASFSDEQISKIFSKMLQKLNTDSSKKDLSE